MDEGQVLVQFDELLDPRPSGKKPGVTYYFVSVKKPGQGTAELYVTHDMYKVLQAMKLVTGDMLVVTLGLNKWNGQFEPRVLGISAAA